jgi:hypothetical protein
MILAQLDLHLICDGQPDLDNLAHLLDSGHLNFRIGLAGNECQRHQGHNGQADDFVEVSNKKGFHCCYSEENLSA